MVYNHTYMPIDYGRDPLAEYQAITSGVTLWDVGAERQAELRGPDALAFADYLSPRDLLDLAVGRCRFTPVLDPRGQIMCDCIVLRPFEDVVWYSHSDVDLSLWAYGLALARGADVTVEEADVAPVQLQGPLAREVLEPLYDGDLAALRRFDCAVVDVAGVRSVVSNTGWSKEPGYEIYPIGTGALPRAVGRDRRRRRAARAAGHRPEHHARGRAGHHRHAVPHELGHDRARGRARGRCWRSTAPTSWAATRSLPSARAACARRTIGLVADGAPVPFLEDFWPVLDASGAQVGVARWAVFSYALDRNIAIALVDSAVSDDDDLVIRAPDGDRRAQPHAIPFVR